MYKDTSLNEKLLNFKYFMNFFPTLLDSFLFIVQFRNLFRQCFLQSIEAKFKYQKGFNKENKYKQDRSPLTYVI